MNDFLLFLAVGFVAQVIDGSLGMAYGVISSTVLLSFGVAPAMASASVHAAEVFTTAASAGSHAANRNVDWKLFIPLAVGGAVGGGVGALVLTSVAGETIKPYVAAYLAVMGVLILYRAWRWRPARPFPRMTAAPVGLAAGFLDAIGGGGWGPSVTSAMVASGAEPRISVGTSNTAEFCIASTISATFLASFLTGHWREAQGLVAHGSAVAGLILGGVAAAPLAGLVARIAPAKILAMAVGLLVLGLAGYQTAQLIRPT